MSHESVWKRFQTSPRPGLQPLHCPAVHGPQRNETPISSDAPLTACSCQRRRQHAVAAVLHRDPARGGDEPMLHSADPSLQQQIFRCRSFAEYVILPALCRRRAAAREGGRVYRRPAHGGAGAQSRNPDETFSPGFQTSCCRGSRRQGTPPSSSWRCRSTRTMPHSATTLRTPLPWRRVQARRKI